MANAAVHAAVKARLVANWTKCAIIHANDGGDVPDDGSSFLTVQYPVAIEDQTTFGAPGANCFRERGVIRLVLSCPSGYGLEEPLTWIDELRALFRSKQFDGVTTFAASGAVIEDDGREGNYFVVTCAIPYFYDIYS